MIKINDCTMFNDTRTGKFSHDMRLRPEFEEKLAALMIEKNQKVNEALELAIRIAFNQFSTGRRAELIEQVDGLRKGKIER